MKTSAVPLCWGVAAVTVVFCYATRLSLPPVEREDFVSDLVKIMPTILEATTKPECSSIIIIDGDLSNITLFKEIGYVASPRGVGVFEVTANGLDANVTDEQLLRLIGRARRLRRLSFCVRVVVVSEKPVFLTSFARSSLKGRLLLWSTRLLVVTRLPQQVLRHLLSSHWTFSMMNTIIMNIEDPSPILKCGLYVHLPYGPQKAKVLQLASWTSDRGLSFFTSYPLFPEKFSNFYGGTVNVTALPYAPYWMTSVDANTTVHSGIDYMVLETLARALNFTFHVLPSANWGDVTYQVQARTSFMASIIHVLLPERMEKYDYTFTFDYSPLCFAMAKPTLKPQWQGLYYPLANEVWAAILATTLLMCVILSTLTRAGSWRVVEREAVVSAEAVVQEVVGTLLGQCFTGRLSYASHSNRVLVAAWLVFAFIVGIAYRGNLTASLTLPKYPHRPETVEELVRTVDKAAIESYGDSYKRFFMQSESSVFSALGNLMFVGVGVIDGLQEALTENQAHMDTRQYLERIIAQHFTRIDGSSQIYIGRESILPSISSWPIPHDAPYKASLDYYIMAITEAGLYEKWRKDYLRDAERESRERKRDELRKRQQLNATYSNEDDSSSSSISVKPLTIIHMQGPLMLLLLGLIIGGEIFAIEKLAMRFSTHHKGVRT